METQLINHPFTQSWIQALTLAAENPLVRTIKPKMDLIHSLSKSQTDADRQVSAQTLWDFAAAQGLVELLQILPTLEANWVFDTDDKFLYRRAEVDGHEPLGPLTFERWKQAMGLEASQFPLVAEVYCGDWTSLVRSEAVRLQKRLNTSAVLQTSTMQLPCTARWDTKQWSVQFDQVDWIMVAYDDLPVMRRPDFAQLEERLMWSLANANDALVVKKAAACSYRPRDQAWYDCVHSLRPLHSMMQDNHSAFSTWLLRTWNCVWPIVYREQNQLREKADIDWVRTEFRDCLAAQPKLCVWMFVFAKLVCQSQIGTGLGICADFGD